MVTSAVGHWQSGKVTASPRALSLSIMQPRRAQRRAQPGCEPRSVHLERVSSQPLFYAAAPFMVRESGCWEGHWMVKWGEGGDPFCELLMGSCLLCPQPGFCLSRVTPHGGHSRPDLLGSPGRDGPGRRVRDPFWEAVTSRGTTLTLLITLSAFIEKMLSASEFASTASHLLRL